MLSGHLAPGASGKSVKAILLRDLGSADASEIQEGFRNGLSGPDWTIFWIDRAADPALETTLGKALAGRRPPNPATGDSPPGGPTLKVLRGEIRGPLSEFLRK